MPPTTIRTVAAFFILAGLADVGAAALHTGQASARKYGGRPVAQVLTELQRSTLRIIFSSELVPADLLVRQEPRATDPREIVFQILEPHGLTLRQGPGGTLLVVPLPRPKPQTPKAAPATPREPPPPTIPETPPLPRVEEHGEVSDRTDVTGIETRAFSFEPSVIQETAGNMENVLQTLRILPAAAAISDDEGRFAVRGGGPGLELGVGGWELILPFSARLRGAASPWTTREYSEWRSRACTRITSPRRRRRVVRRRRCMPSFTG